MVRETSKAATGEMSFAKTLLRMSGYLKLKKPGDVTQHSHPSELQPSEEIFAFRSSLFSPPPIVSQRMAQRAVASLERRLTFLLQSYAFDPERIEESKGQADEIDEVVIEVTLAPTAYSSGFVLSSVGAKT